MVCSVYYATLLALADVRYKKLRATLNVHARKKRKEKDRERIELACFGPFCVTKKYIYKYIGWWEGRGEAIAIESERCMARGAYKKKN